MTTAAKLETGRKKSPSRELGGLGWGFLIVETKTHPVTVDITNDRRIRFLQSPE
jgi:hypothetical protein